MVLRGWALVNSSRWSARVPIPSIGRALRTLRSSTDHNDQGDKAGDCSQRETCAGNAHLASTFQRSAIGAGSARSPREHQQLHAASASDWWCSSARRGRGMRWLHAAGDAADSRVRISVNTAPVAPWSGEAAREPSHRERGYPGQPRPEPDRAGTRHFEPVLSPQGRGRILKSQSGRQDSNLRPSAPKAPALPSCATPRRIHLSRRAGDSHCSDRHGERRSCRGHSAPAWHGPMRREVQAILAPQGRRLPPAAAGLELERRQSAGASTGFPAMRWRQGHRWLSRRAGELRKAGWDRHWSR